MCCLQDQRQKKREKISDRWGEKSAASSSRSRKKEEIDESYEKRAHHQAIDGKSEARRLKDEIYHKKNIKAALNIPSCRLQSDTEFQKRHREVSYRNQLQRLQHDAKFKQRNRGTLTVIKSVGCNVIWTFLTETGRRQRNGRNSWGEIRATDGTIHNGCVQNVY